MTVEPKKNRYLVPIEGVPRWARIQGSQTLVSLNRYVVPIEGDLEAKLSEIVDPHLLPLEYAITELNSTNAMRRLRCNWLPYLSVGT